MEPLRRSRVVSGYFTFRSKFWEGFMLFFFPVDSRGAAANKAYNIVTRFCNTKCLACKKAKTLKLSYLKQIKKSRFNLNVCIMKSMYIFSAF